MAVRYYSSVAPETTLVSGISPANTTMQVQSVAGLPIQYPYTMAVDYESALEELVSVTGAAGTTLTITRAYDGTSAAAHNSGARVRHVSSAQDHRDSRDHEEANTNVHGLGVGSAVIGEDEVQTLNNKTLNLATGTLDRIDIFSSGNWNTTLNGDAGFPSTSLLIFKPDSLSNEVATVNSNGAYIVRNKAAADAVTSQYRFRATKSNGTTEIAYILSGGSVKTFPDDGQSGFTVQPRGVTIDARAFSLRNVADSADVFTVWNNGRVDINGTDPANSQLDVVGAAAQSVNFMRVMDSASANIFAVDQTYKTIASGTVDIRNDNNTGGVGTAVLRVFARQPGQTGDLTQWVDSGNTIRAQVSADGRSDWNKETATTGVFTAASGWSITDQAASRKAGIITIYANIERTGANIVADAAGNIADTDVATVAAAWRPTTPFTTVSAILPSSINDGFGDGAGRLNASTGVITLATWSTGGTVTTGRLYRVMYTYTG